MSARTDPRPACPLQQVAALIGYRLDKARKRHATHPAGSAAATYADGVVEGLKQALAIVQTAKASPSDGRTGATRDPTNSIGQGPPAGTSPFA